MSASLKLYRVSHPDEYKKPWLFNSLVLLAQSRPDLYQFRKWGVDKVSAGAAIYTVSSLGPVRQLGWVLANSGVREAMEADLPLVLDDSGECGLRLGFLPDLEAIIKASGLKRGRIIVVQQNENFPRQVVVNTAEGEVEIRVAILHYWMHRLREEFKVTPPPEAEPSTRFLCLNSKLRPHRAVVLGWLMRSGLIDQGIVSLAEQRPGTAAFNWPSWDEFRSYAIQLYPGFEPEVDAMRPLLETPSVQGDPVARTQRIPYDLHARTGFSLVNETEATSGEISRFTEKVLKPLGSWQPFVVVGNPGTLKLLQGLGFKTFAPAIDESYDQIAHPGERMKAVLREVGRLCAMEDAEFNRLRASLVPVLAHNVDVFRRCLPDVMDRQHADLRDAVTLPMIASRGSQGC